MDKKQMALALFWMMKQLSW